LDCSGRGEGRVIGAMVPDMVFEIAAADAHVVQEVIRDGDSEAHAEDSVGEGEGVEIAIAEEEDAGDRSPDESERDEDGVGNVGHDKEERGERDGWGPRQAEAEELQQDVDLQDELLHESPEGVSQNVQEDGQRTVEGMESAQVAGGQDCAGSENEGGYDDPERGKQAAETEAVGFCFFGAGLGVQRTARMRA